MVNSVCDGMNLVVKEALLLNETDGVIAALGERRAPMTSWKASR